MSHPLLKKLQHKAGPVVVVGAPAEVAPVLDEWAAEGVEVKRRLARGASFVLLFVRSTAELATAGPKTIDALGGDDPVLWIAYPKKSSKRYASDLGRDDAWEPVAARDLEPVRQVAIDADWSAVRFRRVANVKTMTRARALSKAGKERIAPTPDDPKVAAWLDALAEPRRTEIRRVHEVIRATVPSLAPEVSGKMLGYGPFHYVYESGREGDAHRVALASNAQYVSLYVLGGDDDGYLAEQHAPTLGKVKVGKSCIRFRRADELDPDGLRALLEAAAAQHG